MIVSDIDGLTTSSYMQSYPGFSVDVLSQQYAAWGDVFHLDCSGFSIHEIVIYWISMHKSDGWIIPRQNTLKANTNLKCYSFFFLIHSRYNKKNLRSF